MSRLGRLNRRRFLARGGQGTAALWMAGCGAPGPDPREVTDLTAADATAQAALVANGQASPAELLQAALDRQAEVNVRINAVVTDAHDLARQRLEQLGDGPLSGVPYLIKDLTDVGGVRTTYGCRAQMNNIAGEDHALVSQLSASGLNVFGKTNTPEYGLISTTESLALGPCRNPWHLGHSSGGSSGGAAAAVAAGIVPAAQASDGGGSIRIPASCCGLVGLKPTRGRMAGERNDARLTDLAVRHTVSRTVRDTAVLLALSEGQGGASGLPPVGLVSAAGERPLRIAFSTRSAKDTDPTAEVAAAQHTAARLCAALGHEVVEAAPDYDGQAFEDAFLDLWSEGPWALRRDMLASGVSEAGLADLLEPWTLYLADHFENAGGNANLAAVQQVFEHTNQVVSTFMQDYDVWLTPVLASAPPPIGHQGPLVAPDVLKQRVFDYVSYTPLANMMGAPSISLPLHWTDGDLPVGSMFTARPGGERVLLELAYQLETAQPWSGRRPQYTPAG